jgi:BlaI family transcriptional regulator, penicillinase repressor
LKDWSAMARKGGVRLGELQLRIMRVLWDLGAATVSEVQDRLGRPRLAYTTVATMLRKMEDRGLVDHREEGRKFHYRALLSEGEVTRSMAGDLVERLFAGSLTDAVSHLLEHHEISRDELDRLEQLIRQRKNKP